MRQILFRGKTANINGLENHNSYWVYGLLVDSGIEEYPYKINGSCIIPETVGQFTGLKDKNGDMILEGDILRGIADNSFNSGFDKIHSVIWGIDHWHIKGTFFTMQEFFNYCNNNIEIIGNIHDNPELIK